MVNLIWFEEYIVLNQIQKSMTYGYPQWLPQDDTTSLTLPTPDPWFVLFIQTRKNTAVVGNIVLQRLYGRANCGNILS
jgi:hypothetical protein